MRIEFIQTIQTKHTLIIWGSLGVPVIKVKILVESPPLIFTYFAICLCKTLIIFSLNDVLVCF
jgi:hypothetical protein